MPLVINQKMINQQRFAGFLAGLGQLGIMAEHIDKRRLTYVTATNKRVLRQITLRARSYVGVGDDILSGFYHKCRWKPSGAMSRECFVELSSVCGDLAKGLEERTIDLIFARDLRYLLCETCVAYVGLGEKYAL